MQSEKLKVGILEHWTAKETAEAFLKDEIIIIDVRTPQEFLFERIEGALLAPMQAFRPDHMPSQRGKRIVFHCGSGARSRMVAERCLSAGEDRIAHIEGGFAAWKVAGLPYIGTDLATGAPKVMKQGKKNAQ